MSSLRHARFRLTGALSVGAVLAGSLTAGLVVTPADAAAGSPLVINEVYGAGGNSGAVYNADFVELYNPSDTAADLGGLYLHYRAASGGSGGSPYALSGSVPAHATYLVQMSSTGSTGAALPTPDAGPAGFNMAAAGGQVYLLAQSTPIATTGDQVGAAGVVDMVGAKGSSSFETAATGSAATATGSLQRTDGADTDSNVADFSLAAPTPTNSGSGDGGGDGGGGT